MHELLLFGVVPPTQHRHILSVLAGISAMQPLPFFEQHQIFKPTRKAGTAPQAVVGRINSAARPGVGAGPGGGSGNAPTGLPSTDLFYVQLVGDLSSRRKHAKLRSGEPIFETSNEEAENPQIDGTVNGVAADTVPWTFEFRDLPDVPGKRPATSRLMASIPISQGDPLAFMEAMGFASTVSYYLSGHSLTHNSITLRVYQTLPANSASSANVSLDPANLPPLDQSGSYLLQASLRVQDGSRPELMERGFTELAELKNMLKGIVDLQAAERLSLDPRVR